jgi:hypothetical protein
MNKVISLFLSLKELIFPKKATEEKMYRCCVCGTRWGPTISNPIHCHWCLTPIDRDGNVKATYRGTMVEM